MRSISVAVPVSLVLAVCASLVLDVSGIRLGPRVARIAARRGHGRSPGRLVPPQAGRRLARVFGAAPASGSHPRRNWGRGGSRTSATPNRSR